MPSHDYCQGQLDQAQVITKLMQYALLEDLTLPQLCDEMFRKVQLPALKQFLAQFPSHS